MICNQVAQFAARATSECASISNANEQNMYEIICNYTRISRRGLRIASGIQMTTKVQSLWRQVVAALCGVVWLITLALNRPRQGLISKLCTLVLSELSVHCLCSHPQLSPIAPFATSSDGYEMIMKERKNEKSFDQRISTKSVLMDYRHDCLGQLIDDMMESLDYRVFSILLTPYSLFQGKYTYSSMILYLWYSPSVYTLIINTSIPWLTVIPILTVEWCHHTLSRAYCICLFG